MVAKCALGGELTEEQLSTIKSNLKNAHDEVYAQWFGSVPTEERITAFNTAMNWMRDLARSKIIQV